MVGTVYSVPSTLYRVLVYSVCIVLDCIVLECRRLPLGPMLSLDRPALPLGPMLSLDRASQLTNEMSIRSIHGLNGITKGLVQAGCFGFLCCPRSRERSRAELRYCTALRAVGGGGRKFGSVWV